MDKLIPTVQAIDGDGVIPDDIENVLKQFDVPSFGSDYYVISILGSQSSGKSTLLNYLFGTRFEVLDAKQGRKQTTLGVWLGVTKSEDKNVIVLDVEGTDSKERGEDHGIFERKTSLLSLALSEILIINMWVHDIGRFEGANYGLLKIVLELNLQLFQSSGKNKQLLLFVIREHLEEESPLVTLSSALKEDMRKIWETIAKPSQFENSNVEDFFVFDFIPLPSKRYLPKEFELEVDKLRTRFMDKTSENPFLTKEYKKDVPSDGFARYLCEIWEAIQENKELNLPSQKQMLSIYRCEQISNEAYEEVRNLVDLFDSEFKEKSKIANFSTKSWDAVQKALTSYDENASRYDKEISDHKREQLFEKINRDLYNLYKLQLGNIRKKILDEFEKECSLKFDSMKPTKDFISIVNEMNTRFIEKFEKKLQVIIIEGFKDWNANDAVNELKSELDSRILKLKDKQLSLLMDRSYKSFNQHFDRKIKNFKDKRELNSEEIWKNLRQEYNEKLKDIYNSIDEYIKELEIPEQLKEQKEKVQTRVNTIFCDLFKDSARDAYILAENIFTSIFTKRENGLPRRWSFGDNVEKEFVKAKNIALRILDILSIIRLDENDFSYSWFTEEEDGSLKAKVEVPDIPEDLIAINYDDCVRHVNHFLTRTEFDLRKALSDQEIASSGKYPIIVAIVMFLIFGWDEAKTVLTSPILFFFTSIFIGSLYIVYKLDLFPYVIKTILIVKDQLLRQMVKEKED